MTLTWLDLSSSVCSLESCSYWYVCVFIAYVCVCMYVGNGQCVRVVMLCILLDCQEV